MSRNILVLGGSGFLGSAICKALADRDEFQVYSGDINPKTFPESRFIRVDVLDSESLDQAFRGKDIVINCTGQITRPVDTCLLLNSAGINNIAKACRQHGIFLIQISSVNVYGTSTVLTTEESRVNPETPYAVSKAIAELLLAQQTQQEHLAVLRLSNLYGPGQEKGIMSYIVHAFNKQETLTFNNDGSLTRYYIHIDDVAEIINQFIHSGPHPGIFNIKGPDFLSIKELIELYSGMTGQKPLVDFSPALPVENLSSLDDRKIREIMPVSFNHHIHSFLQTRVNQF